MIRFFRNSFFIQYLMLLVLALLLWLPSFIVLPAMPEQTGVTPLYDLVVAFLAPRPLLSQIIAFVLFIVEAFAFNEIMVVGKTEPKVSTMGGFAFILLMSLTPMQTAFTPTLLATALILPILYLLYKIPMLQKVETDLLNMGILLSLASMCYIHSALLLIWMLIALAIQRSKSIRYGIIPIIGFLLPYLFFFAIHYVKGDLVATAMRYADFYSGFNLSVKGFDVYSLVAFAVIVMLSFLPLGSNTLFAQECLVDVRQNISIASLLFLFTLVIMVLEGNVFGCGLAFFALSVHNSYSLSHVARTKWPEIILDIFVLSVLAIHYIPLFI